MYTVEIPSREISLTPFLKWAGGKRQLLPEIHKYKPKEFNCYFEPFLGAGAVLFDFQPNEAVVNDSNIELINCYDVIKNNSEELIVDLSKHIHSEEYYYKTRNLDREESFKNLSNVKRASRFIFLNRTCFNGLYRVNSKGHFNVPFGKYKNPNYQNFELLKSISSYLNNNDITIHNTDFYIAVAGAEKGDFIYFDPPYDPLNKTSSFTSYQASSFTKEEQVRLRDTFVELDRRGCKVMLSNSSTPFVAELYKDYKIVRVKASRAINSKATGRGQIDEFLVMNYT